MFGPVFASTNLECPDAKKDQKGMPLQHQNLWKLLSEEYLLQALAAMAGIVSGLEVARAQCESKQRLFWFIIFDSWKQRLFKILLRLMAVALTGLRGWAVTKSRATPNPVMLLDGNFRLPHALTLFFPLAQCSMIGS